MPSNVCGGSRASSKVVSRILTRRLDPSTIAAESSSIGCVCLSLLMLLYRRETHMKVLSPQRKPPKLFISCICPRTSPARCDNSASSCPPSLRIQPYANPDYGSWLVARESHDRRRRHSLRR